MKINKLQEKYINYLIPIIKKSNFNCNNIMNNDNDKDKLIKIYSKILDDIIEGNYFIELTISSNNLNSKLNNISDVKDKLEDSKFFPEHIKKYIYKNGKKFLSYSCYIDKKLVNIHFMLFNLNNINFKKYDNYVYYVYIWLYICNKYSNCKTNNDNKNIYIYPTPYKKKLPKNKDSILSPSNVNTGFTYNCGNEIVIYRKEEWFKVLIHETIHNYSFDFDYSIEFDNLIVNKIKNMFPLNINLNIFEIYTEILTRIVNSAFFSYKLLKKPLNIFYKNRYDNSKNKNKSNHIFNTTTKVSNLYDALKNNICKKDFYLYINFILTIERFFSLFQINKILSFMNLTYFDLFNKSEKSQLLRDVLYKQNTHIFEYYIVPAILLNNYKNLSIWCSKYNNFYKFSPLKESKNDFIQLIRESYRSEILLDDLILVNKIKKNNIKNYDEIFDSNLKMIIFDT